MEVASLGSRAKIGAKEGEIVKPPQLPPSSAAGRK